MRGTGAGDSDTIGNWVPPAGECPGLLAFGSHAAPKSMVAVVLAMSVSAAFVVCPRAEGSVATLTDSLTPDHGAPFVRTLSRPTTLVVPPVSRTGASEVERTCVEGRK